MLFRWITLMPLCIFLGLCEPAYAQEEAVTLSGRRIFIYPDGTWKPMMLFEGDRPEIPALQDGELLIEHPGFCLVYDEVHEQARWVAYTLTDSKTHAVVSRSNNFREDPEVPTGSAGSADYRKSGFDRGHLAPAADMAWSEPSMDASFYYSNMSPQHPSCNRGVWKRLEEQVRRWAIQYDSIYVVTGPLLHSGLPVIGHNKVSVPEAYFKTVLRYDAEFSEVIAFVVPNEGSRADLKSFTITVDSLEQLNGTDFFPALTDSLENRIEGRLCLPCWSWD